MNNALSGTLAERYDHGVRLRRKTPREKHADLLGPGDRDPVAILAAGDRTRVPALIPVRYERMLASPFTFLRGAAAVMGEDLKHQASPGVAVQACGDCHLMNFGAFATPEENILFDINDFDETLPGVDFTVDLKRLAASVAVAALAANFSKKQARAAAAATIESYRTRMRRLVLAGYMGKSGAFDDALASFAMAYATRTQNDYDKLAKSKWGSKKQG
jgi:uncharacterized protein (DUF2252 family)